MVSPQLTTKSMLDRGIPVAELSLISLAKLRAKDKDELALLEEAASDTGFLHLDLRGDPAGDRMLGQLPDLFSVAERYFMQPEAAKAQDTRLDVRPSQDLGWKKGHDAESFEISRDETGAGAVTTAAAPPPPELLRKEWTKIEEFNSDCWETTRSLLQGLSPDFTEYHRPNEPSDTGLKFVSHPASEKQCDVRDNLHTDDGTLTLLFYNDWSIHAFFRKADIWAFIPPLAGCVLVNVANSLQRLSGGRLHSPEHRVTQPFDGAKSRYYVSYLLRPENAVISKWHAGK